MGAIGLRGPKKDCLRSCHCEKAERGRLEKGCWERGGVRMARVGLGELKACVLRGVGNALREGKRRAEALCEKGVSSGVEGWKGLGEAWKGAGEAWKG